MSINNSEFLRKSSLFIATCCLALGVSANAKAGLLGQDVFGVLNFGGSSTNLFDPANTGLPQGTLNEISNPVTVSDGVGEFSYVDNGVIGIFINIRDDSLTISNDVVVSVPSWSISLTSAGFLGLVLTETSDSFVAGGVNGLLVGDTLTLNWVGTSAQDFYRADFDLLAASSGVPEPGSLALVGLSLAGLGVSMRTRRRRKD